MNIQRTLAGVRADLRAKGTAKRAAGEKKYLKSSLTFLGATVPVVRATAKAFARAHPELGRDELVALVEAAWATDVHELRSFGIALLGEFRPRLRAGDMKHLESMLRRAGTWAHVDWQATDAVADVVERYPSARRRLDRWAKDDDFWIRRSAMLALLPPLRRGGGDFEGFAAMAIPMLGETEFFIRKACGAALRQYAHTDPDAVRAFVDAREDTLSGLTKREARKHLDR